MPPSNLRSSFNMLFWLLAAVLPLSQAMHLNITALAGVNGSSVLQCWQLDSNLVASTESGTAGAFTSKLGNVTDMTYTILPAGFNGGTHNAPAVQYVVFLSGLAHITLPNDPKTEAYVLGGEFGIIIAADTAAVSKTGHVTTYPGVTETVALEIPTKGGVAPAHKVLYNAPCRAPETIGVKNAALGG